MKKKGDKEKEGKQKIDYNELISKNLDDFRLIADYSGYQFTKLDLKVYMSLCRINLWISYHHSSRNLNT